MAISICEVHTNTGKKETTPHGDPVFPVACYEDDMQVVSVPAHWHDEFEYIAAVKGVVTVTLDTFRIELNAGDSVFINSGCLHSVSSVETGDSILRSLVILPKFIGGSSDGFIWQKLVLPFSTPDAPSYIFLNDGSRWQNEVFSEMMLAWDAVTGEVYDYENEARFHISRAMRFLTDNLSDAFSARSSGNRLLKRIKLALAFIEEHYMDDISMQDLIDLCRCSESVLLRSFHHAVGTSPMQYLLSCRIQKASEKLLSTDEKSYSIAASCGFHDCSYFTKTFKQKTGFTPVEYRKVYSSGR